MRTSRQSTLELIDLANLIKSKTEKRINFIEVGVYSGESTRIFLDNLDIGIYYAIDPWKTGYDDLDQASSTDMCEVERIFDNNILKRYENVVKFKGTLDEFSQTTFKSIDIVYIDANHQYDFVKSDMLKTIRDIRPSIAICGHDFMWQGVQRAIFEIIGVPDAVYGLASWVKFLGQYAYTPIKGNIQ